MMQYYDVICVGAGPAGMAAALSARENGAERVCIIERDHEAGGILQQCIHNGFGLQIFKEDLTGPEYAQRFINAVKASDIDIMTDTMVLEITADKELHIMSPHEGYRIIRAGAIILCMGCRERTRGALAIPGTRPAGVMTAGAAQRLVNMEGYMIGKRVVILGSGDIGLIMARRLTLEGAKVLAVAEIMPFSGGLTRNIVQCLEDYNIPLLLSHTVTNIKGRDRLEAVEISEVDANGCPLPGSEKEYVCDTLLLSVGLLPEIELPYAAGVVLDRSTRGPRVNESMETSVPGIFACGNIAHVHDLVDYVTIESRKAGKYAARYIQGRSDRQAGFPTIAGKGIAYIVPHEIRPGNCSDYLELYFRVSEVCHNVKLLLRIDEKIIKTYRKKHLAPGEMESLRLPHDIFCKARSLRLDIEK